jgi:RTX calcium-binding nonapeptide repeat (4 copies)
MSGSSIKEATEMDQTRSRVLGGRTKLLAGFMAISALTALVALPAGPALAKRIVGTNGADKIVGTKKADRINARRGSDRVTGRAGGDRVKGSRGKDRLVGGRGGDRLNGSRGRDRIKGAKGKDRLAGGKGADALSAVDGKRDRAVNGGPGKDVCAIDQADLPVLKNCEKAKVRNGGKGRGLRVTIASGLACGSPLPLCRFQIEGRLAESAVGSVSGAAGVTLAVGAGVAITGGNWTAAGLYGCSTNGNLKVTIGSKSVRVPITCT